MSKASAGIRTIALRISGTEEAKNEIQDMGEDIDDFVVRTKSKTDQIIRDYTAVASNAYKGVSVLDENGNLRDTYDILLDIAEIYEEIQKEDKKLGTNRAQALVETLAGKNRSNIAASILQNADILRQVRDAAANDFMGSADQELSKYLDSIEGKVAQFKNRLQELASVSIDSQWIKDIVSFGTKALEVITSLGKQFGTLNLAVGAIMGIFAQKKGLGIFNFDKRTGETSFGIPKILNSFKESLSGIFGKKSWGNEVLESAFKGISSETKINDILGKMSDDKQRESLVTAMGPWWKQMADSGKAAEASVGDALDNIGKKAVSLGSVFSNLGKIGATALSTIGTMAISMLASFAIEKAVEGIINFIRREEIAIEKGKEARQTIADINKEFSSKQSFASDENIERYSELRKGVEVSATKGVKNKNLSNEEFEEFLSLNQQIADLFPSLVTGFDNQGNAMVNLSSNADKAKQSIHLLLEQERQMADFKVGEQLSDAVVGFSTRYRQLQEDIAKQTGIINAGQELQKGIEDGTKTIDIDLSKFKIDEYGTLSWDYDVNNEIEVKLKDTISDIYSQAAHDIYKDPDFGGSDSTIGKLVMNLKDGGVDDIEKLKEAFSERIRELKLSDIPESILSAMQIKNADIAEIKADWNAIVPSILSQLNLYEEYQDLGDFKFGDQIQSLISNSISNMRFDKFSNDDWELFGKNPRQFVRERYMEPIINALKDESGNVQQDLVSQLSNLINLDTSNMTNEEMTGYINSALQKMFPKDTELQVAVKVALGWQYYDENGKNHWNATDIRNNIFEAWGGTITGEGDAGHRYGGYLNWSQVKQLTQEQQANIVSGLESGALDPSVTKFYDDLLKWLDEYQNKTEEIEKDGTLSSVLLNEAYKTQAENYEKSLSSLTSALETIRNEGQLTAEAMRDLQEQFPELTDFSFESVSNEAEKQLGGWIKTISAEWKDMSPKGVQQMQTYITNLATSYGELGISAEEAQIAVRDSIAKSDAAQAIARSSYSSALPEYISSQYEDAMSDLKEKYGDDINWQIVWTLAMEDRFSDPTANILEEYQDMELVWTINVEDAKALAEIEKAKEVASNEEAYHESVRSNKEAHGETLTSSDYTGSVNVATNKKELIQREIDIIKDEITRLLNSGASQEQLAQAYSDYLTKVTELNNADTELANVQKQKIEAGANELKKQESDLETSIQKQELKISDAEANKVDPDIIDGYRTELSTLQSSLSSVQYQIYQKYLNDFAANNSEFADEFTKTANEYLSKSQDSRARSKDTLDAIKADKWTRKEAVLDDLSTQTTNAENLMKQREEQGYKIEESYYQGAIKAATKERKELVKQQKEAEQEKINIRKQLESKGWNENRISSDKDYQQADARVKKFSDRILSLGKSITGWRKQVKTGIRLDELSAEFNQLERNANRINKVLNNEKKPAGAADYIGASINAEKQILNLQEQINIKQQDLAKTKEGSPAYERIQEEIDSLKSSIDSAKESQDEFARALLNMPIDNINQTIDKYKTNLSALQDQQALNAKKGIRRTAEDIQKEIDENQNILNSQKGLGWLYKAADWGLGKLGYEETSKERKQLAQDMAANQSNILTTMASIFDLNKEKLDLPITNLQKDIAKTQKAADGLKVAFDEVSSSGRQITEADYEPLQKNLDDQILKYERLIDLNADRQDDYDVKGTDLETEYINAQIDANQQILNLKQQQHEYDLAIANIPVTNLQNELDNMQKKEQEINDLISNKQAKGLKANERDYKNLATLSRAQIKNLQDQNKEYDSQLKRAKELKLSWQEQKDIRDNIAANKSTISGLEVDAIGFDEQAKNLLVTQAKDLAANISTALSEVTTETGLAQETIEALKTGFSDLSDEADISKVFYNTTDGVKVNVVALEELAKKQNEIVNAQFAQKMAEAQQKLADAAKGTDAYKQATEEIRQLMEQQAEYFAQYEEQMKKFNEHGMIELADATKNQGEGFDKAVQYMKSAKEMWDKGLIGTDDFKTRAAYFDAWGLTDEDSFKANYDRIAKYFNEEDAQTGLRAFYSDLKKEGLATYATLEDGTEVLTANFESIAEAAQKMNMSEIAFRDIWGKAEEYGGVNIYIDSMQEATLKTNEYKTALENAQKKYAEMISKGAGEEALNRQKAVIDEIKQNLTDVEESTQNYIERTENGYVEGFQNIQERINKLRLAKDAGTITGEQFVEEMQSLADEYDLKLNFKAGRLEIDQASYDAQAEKLGLNYMDKAMEAAQERYETAKQVYQNDLAEATLSGVDFSKTVYGNIDTNKRQAIMWDMSTLEANKSALQSWYSDALYDWSNFTQDWQGTLSTVMGTTGEYNGMEIAFSPMLQTDHGAQLLSKDTVDTYISTIFDDLSSREGGWKTEDLFELDAKGIEVDGQLIKGLIADIGETAQQTSEQMHYLGTLGALNTDLTEYLNSEEEVTMFERIKEASADASLGIDDLINKLSEVNFEDLDIEFGDGELSEQYGDLEKTLDGLLQQFGLGQDQGHVLLSVLEQIVNKKQELQSNVGELINKEEAQKAQETLDIVKELADTDKIEIDFSIDDKNKSVEKLTSEIEALKKERAGIDSSTVRGQMQRDALTSVIQDKEVTLKIKTELEESGDAKARLEELKSMDEKELAAHFNVDVNSEEFNEIKAQIDEMKESDVAITVSIATDQFEQLTKKDNTDAGTATITILAENKQANEVIESTKASVEEANPIMKIFGNGSEAINTGSQTKASIEAMDPVLHIGAETSGVSSAIDSALSGPHTITINANVVGMPKYNGTLAMASGTAYNVLNYKTLGSYAGGSKVSLSHDEDALVNELAPNRPESIVRDGKWMIIPGGPHVESLKKGDIIFNADQTEDLIKHGATGMSARAYAQGSVTAYSGISAFGGPRMYVKPGSIGGSQGLVGSSSISSSSATSNSIEEAADKLNEASDNISESSEEEKSALDGFKEWLGKLFDWVEIKLEKMQKRVDNTVDKAEQAFDNKQYVEAIKHYNDALSESAELLNVQTQAVTKYQQKADEVMRKAIETGAISEGQAQEIKIKIENGGMDIEEYDDDLREIISSYQTWAEKVDNAKDRVNELNKSLKEHVEKIKEVAKAQVEDIKASAEETRGKEENKADLYSSIGGKTYAYTAKAKYGQARAAEQGASITTKAYAQAAQEIYSGVATARGGAINAIKANKDTNEAYNKLLMEARTNLNNGRKVSDDVIKKISERNPSLGAQLEAFNLALDNAETAQLEYLTRVAEETALKNQNINDKYDNIDSQIQDEISELEKQNQGDLTASQKNHNLDRIVQRQNKLAENASAKATEYGKNQQTYRAEIRTMKANEVKGANYSGLLPKAKQAVNAACQQAKDAAKSGKLIDASLLTKLAQYASSGLISGEFFTACFNYNDAVERRIEAEDAAEIAKEEAKQKLKESASQKVSNISEAAETNRNKISREQGAVKRNLAARKAKGENVEEEEQVQIISENRQLYGSYKEEIRDLDAQIKKNLETKAWTVESKEYQEAQDKLEELKNNASEAGIAIVEATKNIGKIKFDRIVKDADNAVKDISAKFSSAKRSLDYREARGEDVGLERNELTIKENQELKARYEQEAKDLDRRIKQNLKNGIWTKESQEYRDAQEQLDEVKNNANEAGIAILEAGKNINQLKIDAFDKAIEKLRKIQSLMESILDLNEAQGNYTDKGQLKEMLKNYESQKKTTEKNIKDDTDELNLIKKKGKYQGKTYQQWMDEGNETNAGKVAYNGSTYDDVNNRITESQTTWNQLETSIANTTKRINELPFEKLDDFMDLINGDIAEIDSEIDLAALKGEIVDVTLLEQKRMSIYDKMGQYNQRIAELQKLIADPTIGEKAKNEYRKQLQQEEQGLKNTTKELIQTNQAIENLDFDKLDKSIETWNKMLNAVSASLERKKAEGHYLTKEDYEQKQPELQQIYDATESERDRAKENYYKALENPNELVEGFSAAQWFDRWQELIAATEQAGTALANNAKDSAEAWRTEASDYYDLMAGNTRNWEEHLQTKESNGEYITADDIQTTIGLVYEELYAKIAEQAEYERLAREAEQDGREADAVAYQKLMQESQNDTEALEQKIFGLRDQVTAKEIEACDEIINYWTRWIEQYKSTLDSDETKWTAEEKKNIETASNKIATAQDKKGDTYEKASEQAKKDGRNKAANDYAIKAMESRTSANTTRRSISSMWESKSDSSSSQEEDTLADKLQRELNILDAEYNILKSKQDLLQAQGEEIDPDGYQKRIDALLTKIKKNEELVKANMDLANSSKGDDKKAKEYLRNAKQAQAEAYNLQVEMQNLGDEMRKTWITKDLDEFIDKLKVLYSSLETISGFISDDMMYSMGKITDYGLTSMAMLIKSYEVNNKELGTLLEKRAAYIEEYNEGQNPYYSKKEFIEDYKDITAEIQKVASNGYTLMNKIVDATVKMHEEEVKQIQDVIDKRKELLSQQKDYYSWDKTLKQKTNDISILEKQRAALQGLTDSESRARLQKINKQIADARKDLEETVKDHSIELQVNGLDALKESLQKSIEEFGKQARSDVENLMSTVDDATELVTGAISRVETNITKMLDVFGQDALDKVSIGLRPYLIPDYTGAQSYILSDGTILDNIGSSGIASGVATGGLSDTISSAVSSGIKYIAPDLGAQMAAIPKTSEHEVNIQSIINNYTINDASDPEKVWTTIKGKTKELANAISEEIMHNVSYKGIKKNWN